MTADDRVARLHLLETGTLVPFRVLSEELTSGLDEGEFALRIRLMMEGEEEEEGEDVVAWGALGFIFVLAMLSFGDARPRGGSTLEYVEHDELEVFDFLEGLRFERGELHFYGDYIRGRRVKTGITVQRDGTVEIETFGRGKSATRWLDRLQGKKPLEAVQPGRGDA